VLLDTDRQLSQWKMDNPDTKEIERFIGQHEFTVEGVKGQRVILPYSLWMYRRAVDFYQSLEVDQELDQYLEVLGFKQALQQGFENKLIRPNNRLQFDH